MEIKLGAKINIDSICIQILQPNILVPFGWKNKSEVVNLPPRNTCRGFLFPDMEKMEKVSLHRRPHRVRIFGGEK